MERQDGLYTLVQKHPDGAYEAHVVGSIAEYLLASDDPEAVIEKLASAPVRIVSLTVTEGGYNLDDVTGEFDRADPDVQHDLAAGAVPRTTFGLVTEGLRRRRERGLAPFTIMSCDNLPGNGHLTRKAFTSFARLRDARARRLDRERGAVPELDGRPDHPGDHRRRPARRSASGSASTTCWPVVCEPFTQWVLEDSFSAGRPPYEDAGVQVVADVEPYELMKLRLLNAGHQAMAYFGYLCGHELVHEAAQDPLFRAFLLGYMDEEATPTLPPVPGVDLDDYKHTLIERFSNPEVRDTIARLCAESSDRIPKFLVPVIRSQLATGGEIRRSAGIVASWARYAEGVDEQGRPIEVVDRLKDTPDRDSHGVSARTRTRSSPTATCSATSSDDERFVTAYRDALRSLHEHGARATLQSLVSRT